MSSYEKLLRNFENQLDPARPDKGRFPAKIVGYGEISSVLQIPGAEEIVFKRMPPFASQNAIENHARLIEKYCEKLFEAVGVQCLPFQFYPIKNGEAENIAYISQPYIDPAFVGNKYLRNCSSDEHRAIADALAELLLKLHRWNKRRNTETAIGLDAQISNWVFRNGPEKPEYLDYSTPFLRLKGQDQLDSEIFLRSMPFFLLPLVRSFFLQEILDRYFNMRAVAVDLIANLYKEKLSALIPLFVERFNAHFSTGGIEPITKNEVKAYYRQDAKMWALLLNFRRFDRFLHRNVLRKKYNFILPGKVER